MESAIKTKAIVASMFPKNVRDRILDEQAEGIIEKKKKANQTSAFTTGKSELKNYLADGYGDGNLGEALSAFDSKPIADLFPEATVMFADIAGFTAWSSVRQPSEVFQLLETLYRAFDWIAARRKVFKVETIGDCYVAVCGLPEPRKDHAVVMARFARDCLGECNRLTRRLETMLGPDTGDLTMRIGLHSGPVTAGVLRGDNCRFQLFGDTVNTAARVETNGERGRIHCSSSTFELLVEAGKEQWCAKRPDKIVAKGKGEMQTYWVDPRSSAQVAQSTTGSDNNSEREEASSVHDYGTANGEASVAGANIKLPAKLKRLVQWNCDVMLRLLKKVVARREAEMALAKKNTSVPADETQFANNGLLVIEEVKEVVDLPMFSAATVAVLNEEDTRKIEISQEAINQLQMFVTVIASSYRDVPFHNFEHASHVTMSVVKLLSRIVAPDEVLGDVEVGDKNMDKMIRDLHNHTYGITSDPLTQFAVVFSALIHDVDHTGVPNAVLVKEGAEIASLYKNQSVAEQNSVDIAWELLMDDGFKELRSLIYGNNDELVRFRQLVVNTVMATDICDKQLKDLRNARWERAFKASEDEVIVDEKDLHEDVNRKATIVIEHMIQASDIAHTMQHWQIYRKWNEKFFEENMVMYRNGRAQNDPSTYWYRGELGFFDFYIIPLAKKLKECGVFGVSSDEYLNFALTNRKEWEMQGESVVEKLLQKYPPKIEEEDEVEDDLTVHSHNSANSSSKCSSTGKWAMALDEETIYDVTSSWASLTRLDNYEEVAGTILFKHLFTKCPPAKVLFGFPISMDPLSNAMTESKRFLQHAHYMINMLNKAFALLGPDAETLGLILHDLGRKHVRLGVKESFFPFMGESLISMLQELLGESFNSDIQSSWGDVYKALSGEMIRAMNVEKAVTRSWGRLKRIRNYEEIAGSILFKRLFETCPEAKALFGYPVDCELDEALVQSKRFKAHAAYFIEMLDKAVEMVEGNAVDENMKRLGAMHVSYGVRPEFFPLMGDALMFALEKTLKKDWSDQMEEAWNEVYSMLSEKMIAAMKNEQDSQQEEFSDGEDDDAAVENAITNLGAVLDKKKGDDGGVRVSSKTKRLVQWNTDAFLRLMRKIVARREALGEFSTAVPDESRYAREGSVTDEVSEAIQMPIADVLTIESQDDPKNIVLSEAVMQQVNDFVLALAKVYQRGPFHNFERSSHVTMSVVKLLSKVASPEEILKDTKDDEHHALEEHRQKTYGIKSDPTTEFAIVLAALVHHITPENPCTAAWNLLMADEFKDMRATLYTTQAELDRFRQLFVNAVTATDLNDKKLLQLQDTLWDKAFRSVAVGALAKNANLDLKATAVIMQLMQCADIAHTMQHWHIYVKWAEKKFMETNRAYLKNPGTERHPAEYWYQSQLDFFDTHVISIAKRLKECGLFGAACDNYMDNAKSNREQWFKDGKGMVANWVAELLVDDDHSASTTTSSSTLGSIQIEEETMFTVSDSWEVLKRMPNYEEVAGTILFGHLFVNCKPAKVLFGFPISMDPKSEAMKTSKRFLQHATYIIQMFDKALQLLGPDVDTLRVILNDLGKTHVRIGVKESFFPIMGDALMKTLRQLLGDNFDPQTEHAWREVYNAIASEMIRGMNNQKNVLKSWNTLKAVENYQEVTGMLLFKRLFEKCPDSRALFGFPIEGELSDELFTSARFKSHAAYFIEMLDRALNMLEHDQLDENMKRLGAMHVQYGVKPEYFPIMGDALFHALKSTIKRSWTTAVRASWRLVYSDLSQRMISAMRQEAEHQSRGDRDRNDVVHDKHGKPGEKKLPKKVKRLVQWHGDVLVRLLKQLVARREAELAQGIEPEGVAFNLGHAEAECQGEAVTASADVLPLGSFNTNVVLNEKDSKFVDLSENVLRQVHNFVAAVALKYPDVPYHNFEHASHVTMSMNKLFSRIMSPEEIRNTASGNEEIFVKKFLHETFGISADPLVEFTVVLSLLTHAMGHTGLSNAMLKEENGELAAKYKNQSIHQQHSFDLAWGLLMDSEFEELRSLIYRTDEELMRFRTLMASIILATDLTDSRLQQERDVRWDNAFNTLQVGKTKDEGAQLLRKASVVLETMVQASTVIHTMQHYHLYKKWNERSLLESMQSFKEGRIKEDPIKFWHTQQLNFFDYFAIPLAKKLETCGIFGDAGTELIEAAKENRREWKSTGEEWLAQKATLLKEDEMDDNSQHSAHSSKSGSTHGSWSTSRGGSSMGDGYSLVLDEDVIFNVTESWEAFRRSSDDYAEIGGTILFKDFFKRCPPAKVLFGFPIGMDPESESVVKSKRFLQQASYMVQMLDKAIALVGPDAETLAAILFDLGKKHVRLGVKESFFPMMGESLVLMLKEMLGTEFGPEVEMAWQEVYHALSSEMIKAMNSEKTVLISWSKLKKVKNYQVVAGTMLFQQLFKNCPEAKTLFGYPLDMAIDAQLLKNNRFQAHAAYFMDMLDKALTMIETKSLEENMKRLGQMHVEYGVQEEFFPIMGDALMYALKNTLKKDWSDQLEESWMTVYGTLSSQMLSAMQACE